MKSRSLRRLFAAGLLAGLAVIAAILLSACSNDDSGNSSADVIASMNSIDGAGLHGIDQSINTDKTIPPTAQANYQKLQTTVLLTKWPNKDLEKKADNLAKILGDAAAAVGGDKPDLAKAGTAAHNAHEAQHDFSNAVWAVLYDKAGLKVAGAEDGD
jgi:hypothetical protein